MAKTKKTTPSNCKLTSCKYNQLPPGENSQECFSCEGNKDPNWRYTRDTVEPEIVPAYGSGAAEHRYAESIDEWKKRSEKGEVCGILGCPNKPTVRCHHCLNHYCDEHKFVIGGPGHPWRTD